MAAKYNVFSVAVNTYEMPVNSELGLQWFSSSKGEMRPAFEFGIGGRGMYDYYWIYIVACISAFTMAAAMGANDVANAFATSVGSRALKMWQAMCIASVMEFTGGFVLGQRVTDTIRSKIVNVTVFYDHADLLMFGMMLSLVIVTVWVFAASYFGYPVSITHSIIGAILGFALCSPAGSNAVDWDQVGLIIGSWVFSPMLAGVLGAIFFVTIRTFVLRHENSLNRTYRVFPFVFFITIFINMMFIMFKAGIADPKGTGKAGNGFASGSALSIGDAFGVVCGVAGGSTVIVALVFIPLLRNWINSLSDEDMKRRAMEHGAIVVASDTNTANPDSSVSVGDSSDKGDTPTQKQYNVVDRFFHQPMIDAAAGSSQKVRDMHANAEVFDAKTELAFGTLQIFTACFASFAHGSNDVANAAGPLASVVTIYQGGASGVARTKGKSPAPDWTLLIGCFGLVVGLMLYGHKVVASMGKQMIKITPARGFCAELAFSFVIVLGSFLGIPLSTTHCIVGAIVGIGCAEGKFRESVNWNFMIRVFGSWVMTLLFCAFTTALVFSFVTFAPSQVYPLSQWNCQKKYGIYNNVTKTGTENITLMAVNNSMQYMYAYPTSGQFGVSVNNGV